MCKLIAANVKHLEPATNGMTDMIPSVCGHVTHLLAREVTDSGNLTSMLQCTINCSRLLSVLAVGRFDSWLCEADRIRRLLLLNILHNSAISISYL